MKYHPWHTWWYPWVNFPGCIVAIYQTKCMKQSSVLSHHFPPSSIFSLSWESCWNTGMRGDRPYRRDPCSCPVAFKYSRHHVLTSFSIFLWVTTALHDVTFEWRGATLLWGSCGSSCRALVIGEPEVQSHSSILAQRASSTSIINSSGWTSMFLYRLLHFWFVFILVPVCCLEPQPLPRIPPWWAAERGAAGFCKAQGWSVCSWWHQQRKRDMFHMPAPDLVRFKKGNETADLTQRSGLKSVGAAPMEWF